MFVMGGGGEGNYGTLIMQNLLQSRGHGGMQHALPGKKLVQCPWVY